MSAEEQEKLFRRWLVEHTGLMWKVVRAFTGTQQDQEDLLQEILVQLWSSLPSFRGEAKESTWIYRVAFNTALVWKRGEKRHQVKHAAFMELHDPSQSSAGPEKSREEELVELLYAAIRELSKLDASLALMHLDGLSYREMSDVLGLSENNVGVKLNRIRKQLAQQLRGAVDEL
jgi:RNA polymerase sigma-70 factor (ECF subfamily)